MKITYMGEEVKPRIPVRKVPVRSSNGRYAKVRDFFPRGIASILVLLNFIAWGPQIWGKVQTVEAQTQVEVDVTPAKLEGLKYDLVTELARDCESKGTTSDVTPNIFDVNGQGSYGLWRWQIKSVVLYYKKLYGKTITNKEAILIALDDEKARTLTTDVIFKEGGIENWHNCNLKLGLTEEIRLIKKLSK